MITIITIYFDDKTRTERAYTDEEEGRDKVIDLMLEMGTVALGFTCEDNHGNRIRHFLVDGGERVAGKMYF